MFLLKLLKKIKKKKKNLGSEKYVLNFEFIPEDKRNLFQKPTNKR